MIILTFTDCSEHSLKRQVDVDLICRLLSHFLTLLTFVGYSALYWYCTISTL